MTDLRERMPAHAVMEKLASLRGTADFIELPFGIIKPSKDAMGWLRGANGELQMAARLEGLGPSWSVIHSVPVGERGSDIDHIAIGPAGVFTINSKRLIDRKVWVAGGRFLVDGRQRDYIRNSVHEASRIERVLRTAGIVSPIVPVIAISGCKQLTIKAPAEWDGRAVGVALTADVVKRMRKRRQLLSPRDVARIAELFSSPSTWTRRSVEGPAVDEVRAAYAAIDRGVARYRRFWLACLCIVVGGFVLAALLFGSAALQAIGY